MMKIYNLTKKDVDDNSIKIEVNVDDDILWFKLNKKYEKYLSLDTYDCFLVAMLVSAMKRHKDIDIDGDISEKLYYNLTYYVIKMLHILIPSTKLIQIKCKNLVASNFNTGKGVACGLSCGIDSLSCLHDHYYDNKCPKNFQITHVTHFNVGAHGSTKNFVFRKNNVEKFAEENKLEFIEVNSNLMDLNKAAWIESHTLKNCSVALLLQKLIGKYYYSSSYQYRDCQIKTTDDISYLDPALIHLLSTESTQFISHGCQHTRIDKIRATTLNPSSYTHLDVCVENDHDRETSTLNCGKCWKCVRTLITLEMLNKFKLYEKCFDNLENYETISKDYIREYAHKKSAHEPLIKEMIEYAKKINFGKLLRKSKPGNGKSKAKPNKKASKIKARPKSAPKTTITNRISNFNRVAHV